MRTLWAKNVVRWQMGGTLYLSVPFTWLMAEAEILAEKHRHQLGGPVVAGGPAVKLMGASWANETPEAPPPCVDVLALHNPLATVTTRGCIRKCSHCAVPIVEGDLIELKDFKPLPIVCDSNFLAASWTHKRRVVQALKDMDWPCVDFNQGLDCRLFDEATADILSELRIRPLRFSFDGWDQETAIADAVRIAREYRFPKITVYVLIGAPDCTAADALDRERFVQSLGVRPFAMRYQPLDAVAKNGYLAPGWTREEMYKHTQYWCKLRVNEGTPYEDFDPHTRRGLPLFDAAKRAEAKTV